MNTKIKFKNSKAIAILRVSSWRQEGNNSHQVQEDKLIQYCEEMSLELVEIRRITESAKNSEDRIQYTKAIDFALKTGIHNCLFYMSDREARNLTDNEKNEHYVRSGALSIHYVNDRKILHKGSPSGDFLMRDFQAVQNKNFSRILSEKVNDVMRQKAENGWFPGNRPPLGYIHQKLRDKNGKEQKRGTIIVPDSDGNMIRWVRREFELRANGFTIEQIRDSLISEGYVPASKVKSYSKHGVEERLKNKFYWGKFDWQGIEYIASHEKIIDNRTLELVRNSFGIKGKYNRTKHQQSVFSGGFIRCSHPECNLQLVYDPKTKIIKSTGEEKLFKYYRCTNTRKIHSKLQYVSEDKLWSQLSNVVSSIELSEILASKIADALNKLNDVAKETIKKDIANYVLELDKLDDFRNNMFDSLMTKKIDQAEYEYQNNRLQEKRKHFTNLLEQSQLSMSDAWRVTAQKILELSINAKSLWKSGSVEQKLQLLRLITSNRVLNGLNVEYDLNKPFGTISEMTKKESWRRESENMQSSPSP